MRLCNGCIKYNKTAICLAGLLLIPSKSGREFFRPLNCKVKFTVSKPKKKRKLSPRGVMTVKKLKKQCDVLWSQVIRKRDKSCQYVGCLKRTNLQAHHWIAGRAHNATRYDLRNGITLCAGCHKFKVHAEAGTLKGNMLYISRFKKPLPYNMSENEISHIVELANKNTQLTTQDLLRIKESLEMELKC